MAREGYEDIRRAMNSKQYDVVILDEANIAVHFSLLSVDDLLALIDKKPDSVELVFTGRKADPRLLERADLVTEMKEVKHYYQKGIVARDGIEK
jgi:cob(I)alamin adenosyltransferase